MEAHNLTSALDTRTGVGLEPVRRPERLRRHTERDGPQRRSTGTIECGLVGNAQPVIHAADLISARRQGLDTRRLHGFVVQRSVGDLSVLKSRL